MHANDILLACQNLFGFVSDVLLCDGDAEDDEGNGDYWFNTVHYFIYMVNGLAESNEDMETVDVFNQLPY